VTDVSLNAVGQDSDGPSDMANTQSIDSLAGIGDATDHQPSHLPTTIDLVAPALVSQTSEDRSVDGFGTQLQGWPYPIAEDGFQRGYDASIDPQNFSSSIYGATSDNWSGYIYDDVNMPVASLENFDTEEALTNDVPFPQDATTSLSLDPSTLQLSDAMLHETMVYRSSLVQGVNYNQTLESLPLPLPLQLDLEPRLTTLHEPMAKQPEKHGVLQLKASLKKS
jgi:hypothetical protein